MGRSVMTEKAKLVPVRIVDTPPAGPSGNMALMRTHHTEPGHDPHIIDAVSNIGLGGSHIWFVVDGTVELVIDLRPAIEELGNAALIKRETGATYLRRDDEDWSGVPLPPGMSIDEVRDGWQSDR